MIKTHLSLVLEDCFFAILLQLLKKIKTNCHNPYFSRWFSAIMVHKKVKLNPIMSQSLF